MREFLSVHDSHCCKVHGCKYGDDDCPVYTGSEQGVMCEMCEWDLHDPVQIELRELRDEVKRLVAEINGKPNVHTGANISKRYFIYKWSPTERVVLYREQTGSWMSEFDKANLWSDLKFVNRKAVELLKTENKFGKVRDYEVYIGTVLIGKPSVPHPKAELK